MKKQKVYIETYGCQMNVVDSEVVAAILQKHRYDVVQSPEQADLILVNTCSIRDNAEQRVNSRLREIGRMKADRLSLRVGIIGCMAERLKEQLLEEHEIVDLVAGPDAYRMLPELLAGIEDGQKGINTQLSLEETYGDITPVRMDSNNVSAFIAIMRGCNNFCSYCVVPGTRGRERSRDPHSILGEARDLLARGYREITLLGQNVNSYSWSGEEKPLGFEGLLGQVALIDPSMRIRFATSHPKDMSDDLLRVMAAHPNLCRSIHLPVQSGSSTVLKRMNRKYTREHYLDRIAAIRHYLPEASISTDIISGFCGESEADHQDTLRLMREVGYDFAYMFKYSVRPGTYAAKHHPDDVPDETKSRRLNEIIALQNALSLESKQRDVGKVFEVLAEGLSKKSDQQLFGRNSQNKVVVFPKGDFSAGDLVRVKIERCTSATLIGETVD